MCRLQKELKGERIKKKIDGTREEARSDIFDYIEMFYNSKRWHGSSDQTPPTEYENQYYQRLRSVLITCGDSKFLMLWYSKGNIYGFGGKLHEAKRNSLPMG
nr:IS3 family transposase [Trabulsiella odontotermitis]